MGILTQDFRVQHPQNLKEKEQPRKSSLSWMKTTLNRHTQATPTHTPNNFFLNTLASLPTIRFSYPHKTNQGSSVSPDANNCLPRGWDHISKAVKFSQQASKTQVFSFQTASFYLEKILPGWAVKTTSGWQLFIKMAARVRST